MDTLHRFAFQSATDLIDVPSCSVDLVVTSPPYPMIEMWDESFRNQSPEIGAALQAGDGSLAFEAMHSLLDKVWRECYRVLRDGGFACINIGDATRKIADNFRLYTNHSRITSGCESLGFQSLPAILWRKQTNAPNKFMGSGMLPSGAYVTLEHEYVLVLRKGAKRTFAGSERERRQQSAFFWEERNIWFSDIWDFKGTRQAMTAKESRDRSAAFPFEMAFRLVNMYSMQLDTVLDPFVGTGTTTVAAMASGRNSVGIELDSSLSSTIEQTIQLASPTINARQRQRVANHEQFLREYKEVRGREFPYVNRTLGLEVMTRQELDLSVPLVASIRKIADAEYAVSHAEYGDAVSSVAMDGFSEMPSGETQLSLFG